MPKPKSLPELARDVFAAVFLGALLAFAVLAWIGEDPVNPVDVVIEGSST